MDVGVIRIPGHGRNVEGIAGRKMRRTFTQNGARREGAKKPRLVASKKSTCGA